MRQYKCRIAIRLEALERERLERLIFERKFKNLSQAIRAAITEYLNKQETERKETLFLEAN
ncbi:MAG: ribbon-helix-helix domain-containing protein [Candidatus Bathyarchaeota archaeon]|nr:ribbon-helix-helix domain-containing protein [Candidatus Bathyarchaeota archaeon]